MMMNLPCLRGSCPNFLRTIYPTLSVGQAPKRSCPTVKTDASYSSFFCLIVTDLHSPVMVLIGSVDTAPLRFPAGLLQMQSVLDSIVVYGVLFQNPVQSPMPPLSHSTEFWSICYLYIFVSYTAIAACVSSGRLISFNSFCGS